MRIVFWILAGLMVTALGTATAFMSIQIGHDIASGMHSENEPWRPPSPVRSSGKALIAQMEEQLRSINAKRSASVSGGSGIIVMEPVRYERGGGSVRASGSFIDSRSTDDRMLMVVIDAYDDRHRYMTSTGSAIASTPTASTPFALSLADVDVFASFAIRLLDRAGGEVSFLSPEQVLMRERARKGSARLLIDDALYPAYWSEVIMRLRRLEYLDADQWPASGPALNAMVNRFRTDHGLAPMSFIDIGCLLALRSETPGYVVPVKDRAEL